MQELNVEVVPPYMIAAKDAIKERSPAVWTKKTNLPNVAESYHSYMQSVSALLVHVL